METQRGSESTSAQGLKDRLRQDSRQTIENRKRSAADHINEVANALSRASEQLDQSQPTLAAYANQIAATVSNLATRVRDGSIEQLLDDARDLARRNPGMFILSGLATGVVLARFMKASERSTDESRLSSDFAQATAAQEGATSSAYSPALGASEQPYTAAPASTSGDGG